MRKTLKKLLAIVIILIIITGIIESNILYAYSYIDMSEAKQKLEFNDVKEKTEINKYNNIFKTTQYLYTTLNNLLLKGFVKVKIVIHDELINIAEKDENGEIFMVANNTENGIVIYETLENKILEKYLKAENINYWVNITEKWLPEDINNESDGSHNGKYYIAYTFYVENMGQDTVNYLANIKIENVTKNIDEAIRVAVYKNNDKVVYAKENTNTGLPEKGTVKFYDNDTVMQIKAENLEIGEVEKYTIVIWIEGNDQDCIDDLIGGTIKIHMNLMEENIVK